MHKHIFPYSRFLFEQGLELGDPIPAAGAPAGKEKVYHFIFVDDLNDHKLARKKYPDGTLSVDFPCYSTTEKDLDEWTKKNIISTGKNKISDPVIDIRRKNVIDIVKGEKVNVADDDLPFLEKLKNAAATDIFGNREPEVTVVFTSDGTPTTDQINVTFVRHKKQ